MKRIYILVNVLISTAAFAQPVLEQSNVGAIAGDSYIYSRIVWDGNSGPVGADQTWDYSTIVTTTTTALDFVSPSTCPSPSSFPTATVVSNYANQQYVYHEFTNAVYDNVGMYAGGVDIPYTDSERILTFPFTMGDSYVDPFGATFVSGGVTFVRSGNVTVTADGYGDLILPNATITNVLRVKVSEDYGDAIGGVEVYHYNTDIYMFYKPGVSTPVLSLTHYVQGANVTNYGNYIDDASLIVEENKTEKLSVYPNPFSTSFIVETNSTDEKIEVFDILGNLVSTVEIKGENNIEVYLEDKESGVYIVRVSSSTGIREMKLIKE